MKIGVQLPEVERVVRRDEVAALARAAEECGFDSLWVGDHLIYRGDERGERGPWDCWTTLAWLAGITERLTLGPLVACTAFHAPGILARQAAAVHELSGGRLVAALGAGWNEEEFRTFGLPFDHRVSRFEEAFTIIRQLLRGERVTFEGRYHAVHDAVLLPPSSVPKLMVGANAPRMLAITLPHVDAWNTWFTHYGNTADGFAEHNASVSAAAERAGRDPAAIERSACVLVEVERGAGERRRDVAPVPADALGAHLRALSEAGADEAILVLDPITEASIRLLRTALPTA
jgi:alkanesulfonate monooxygenase SsuD/methylene tetrahydromethanopterin reductase-like flavin-dependent oxidoreductase (luciferase family)